MGTFLTYTFVSGLFLLAGYLIYKWLLSQENQPGFNRAIILSIYLVSLVIVPLMQTDIFSPHTGAQIQSVDIRLTPTAIGPSRQASAWPWILAGVYLAGVIAMILWTLATFVRLLRIVKSGERIPREGYVIVLVDDNNLAPFSWGRYIVMSRRDYSEASTMILRHELAHIRGRHLFDLLLAQAVCIIIWYNPASWLMLQEMKSVHEYEADAMVLSSGIVARDYQLLLIKKAVGERFPSLANSLNHSKLKKRITMMQKFQTSPWRRLRALALLPAALTAASVINIPAVAGGIESVSEADYNFPQTESKVTHYHATMKAVSAEKANTQKQKTATTAKTSSSKKQAAAEKIAEFPGGMNALMQWLITNIRFPESQRNVDTGKKNRVVVSFTIDTNGKVKNPEILKGVNEAFNSEALRVVNSMPDWTPATVNGKPTESTYTLPINFSIKADTPQ